MWWFLKIAALIIASSPLAESCQYHLNQRRRRRCRASHPATATRFWTDQRSEAWKSIYTNNK